MHCRFEAYVKSFAEPKTESTFVVSSNSTYEISISINGCLYKSFSFSKKSFNFLMVFNLIALICRLEYIPVCLWCWNCMKPDDFPSHEINFVKILDHFRRLIITLLTVQLFNLMTKLIVNFIRQFHRNSVSFTTEYSNQLTNASKLWGSTLLWWLISFLEKKTHLDT